MTGHNKWAKVKRLKAAADAKRGKIFFKLACKITGTAVSKLNEALEEVFSNVNFSES
jgi:transcriptional/translational regulatory protein YebC/TACO1